MAKYSLTKDVVPYSPMLASVFGVCGSLILQQVHYWTSINKEKGKCFAEGHHWMFCAVPEWVTMLGGFSEKTIRGVLSDLTKMGVLVTGNFNKAGFDKTRWYRLNYGVLAQKVLDENKKNPEFSHVSLFTASMLPFLPHPSGKKGYIEGALFTAPIPETLEKTLEETLGQEIKSATGENQKPKKGGLVIIKKNKPPEKTIGTSAGVLAKVQAGVFTTAQKNHMTATGLASVWKVTVPAYTSVKFVPEFTKAELGMFSQLHTRWKGHNAGDVLEYVLMNWISFCKRVATDTGWKSSPEVPNIGYLLKNAAVALMLWADRESSEKVIKPPVQLIAQKSKLVIKKVAKEPSPPPKVEVTVQKPAPKPDDDDDELASYEDVLALVQKTKYNQ